MNYIVLDLEWNYTYKKKSNIPQGVQRYGEIIQIGAVKLSEDLKILRTFSELIRPIYTGKIKKGIRKLTGIGESSLEDGRIFPQVVNDFLKFCGDDFSFVTWGDNDEDVFLSNLYAHKLSRKPWPEKAIDAQILFDMQVMKTHQQSSLKTALEEMKISFPNHLHDALNDAMATTLIFKHLDWLKAKTAYDPNYFRIQPNSDILKIDSFHFRNFKSFVNDNLIRTVKCPICGKRHVLTKWYDIKKGKANSFHCCGRDFLVRAKGDTTYDGKYAVDRFLHDISNDQTSRRRKQYEYFQRKNHRIPPKTHPKKDYRKRRNS